MIQTILTHWAGPNTTTYSELFRIRRRLYARDGQRIIQKVWEVLEQLTVNEELLNGVDFDLLSDINDYSITLGAMNPVWNEFSVAVFRNMLFYNQLSARAMLRVFKDTLAKVSASMCATKFSLPTVELDT